MYSVEELQNVSLSGPFNFTKGCKLLRTHGYNLVGEKEGRVDYQTLLFDLKEDPKQEKPIQNQALQEHFQKEIARHMAENDAPAELYDRMGI
ncbi:MAG: hypothetical protein RSF83_06820 [Hungatella sp.]